MVLFNYSTKELTAKIVYYGPGLCGKTTNLQWVHEKLPIKNKGKMLSLATETDRTLFFDFLPIELGTIRGMRTRVQLYTVPGQVFYNATRRMVLKGADSVVFVCDSQEPMLEANAESLENLRENLEVNEIDPDEIPIVFQYNKRDLPNALPIEVLNERLNPRGAPWYEAVAIEGDGVEETLKGVTALVFRSLAGKYGATTAPTATSEAPSPTAPAPAPPPPATAPPMAAAPPVVPAPVAARPAGPVAPAASTPVPAAAAPRPSLNLPTPAPAPADELLSSLELEPGSDAGGDLDLGLTPPPAPPAVEEVPLEELALEEEPAAPAPAPPRPVRDPKATLVSTPDEAVEMRRKIRQPGAVHHDPEPIEELPLEEVVPAVELPAAEAAPFELASPDEFRVEEPISDLVTAQAAEPEPVLVEELVAPAPPAAVPRPGLETIPPAPREEAAAPAQTRPVRVVQAAPVSVEVSDTGGPLEVAIPIEVRLEDGSATLRVHVHLTLDLRLPR